MVGMAQLEKLKYPEVITIAPEEQISRLQKTIAKLEDERKTMAPGVSKKDPYLTTFLKYRNVQSLSRGLLVNLINVIYVHGDGSIDVEFNFADPYRRIMEFMENNENDLCVTGGKTV